MSSIIAIILIMVKQVIKVKIQNKLYMLHTTLAKAIQPKQNKGQNKKPKSTQAL